MKTKENEKKKIIRQRTQGTLKAAKLFPIGEYKKTMKNRKSSTFLFILLFVIEVVVCLSLVGVFRKFDLNYRVIRELENQVKGRNQFSTGTYIGKTDFGYFLSGGLFEYTTGSIYKGKWNNKDIHGKGILKIPNEGTYEGEFKYSKKNGTGTFTWNDGAVYMGKWKDDKMKGWGTYTSSENVRYTGIFENNRFKSGKCMFSNSTGTYTITYKQFGINHLIVKYMDGSTYDGETDGKMLSGTGTMKFANGDKYTGSFEDGYRSGQGTYTWSNGDVYNGSWDDDVMEGLGKYEYSNGNYADGEFYNNQFIDGSYFILNDLGKYTFSIENSEAVNVDMELVSGTKYSGDIKDGKLTGNAQISYSNGDMYDGEVKNGYKSGQGIYTWVSGAYYDGDWVKDKMHGKGNYFYPESENGYKLSGKFKKGLPNGRCEYYTTTYESYKTDWTNGKCVKIYE